MLQPRKVAEGRPLADAHHPRVGKSAGVAGRCKRESGAISARLEILPRRPHRHRAFIRDIPTGVKAAVDQGRPARLLHILPGRGWAVRQHSAAEFCALPDVHPARVRESSALAGTRAYR